jgi:hypothetical protein
VYNMSLFLVACLLNRWQRASSARCLQRGLTPRATPRSSKPPVPDSADFIAAEIEVRQRSAMPQHSCKAICPGLVDPIFAEIHVSQRWALRQHSCKTLCPGCSNGLQDCWRTAPALLQGYLPLYRRSAQGQIALQE